MSIFSRRSTRLARRIDSIEGELATISSRIKALSRDVEKKGDAIVDRAGSRFITQTQAPKAVDQASPPTASKMSTEPASRPSDARPVPAGVERGRYVEERRTPRDFPGATPRPAVSEDEQFASYFMSGGLKKEVVEPLRRERHIQRRKAIFLVLCFAALLFSLLFYKYWR